MQAVQTQEKKIVIKAINELGRRVTPADVAAKTGLPILVATSELNKIAAETEGHLEVATTGDIAYRFNAGFQAAYLARGMQKALLQFGQKAFSIGYFLLRVSFGIMLILSAIAVIVLIIAIALASQRGDRDDDGGFGGGFGGGFHFSFFDYLILRDLLYWGMYTTTSPSGRYDVRTTDRRQAYRGRRKSNFLFDCFSFLFGDGNPNANIEERKWQLVAQAIKRNNGVMTAEQLAPYTGADPRNEDGVLPVLARFDGRPEVTEKGDIIYLFPSLQVSAANAEGEKLPLYLAEARWPFTGPDTGSLVPVYLLAAFNFLGSWWLMSQVFIVPALAPLLVVLVTYGTLFVLVPLIRWLFLQSINKGIAARNEKRAAYAEALREPSSALLRKLDTARSYAIGEKKIGTGDIVYTTERDALEQKFEQEIDSRQADERIKIERIVSEKLPDELT